MNKSITIRNNKANKDNLKVIPSLQNLWQDIEKKQQRNISYEQKLQDFFIFFKQQIAQTEQDLCFTRQAFIEHLIVFLSRKTMKKSDIENLHQWILKEIDTIEENRFRQNDIASLRQKLKDALPKKKEPDQNELDKIRPHFEIFMSCATGTENTLSDDKIKQFYGNLDDFMFFIQQNTFASNDQANHEPFSNNNHFSHDLSHDESSLFDVKNIAKLYRQIAKQLHPDKEIEPDKKEYKKALMQQLSKAKKENDTFTLMSMAQQWLPDFDLYLDDNAIEKLNLTLMHKISQLDRQYRKMLNRQDIETIVWRRFGCHSKKKQAQILSDYKNNLIEEKEYIKLQLKKLSSVKAIQSALRSRTKT